MRVRTTIFRSLSIQMSFKRGSALYCAAPILTKGSKDVTIGDIRINATKREVWIAGSPAELTEMEFDLLEILMRSAGRVVSRDELTLALFERKAAPYDRILDVHISHLRKKLEGGRSLIRTIRGVGYVFARMA